VLCDESWFLRELAIDALGEMGDTAVPPLLTLVRSGLWFTRASAAKALGRIGDPRAVLPLVALFDDTNTTVAAAGAEGLVALCRSGSSLAAARAMRARAPEERERILVLLKRVDPDGGRKLAALVASDEWMNALGELSEQTVARIVAGSSDGAEGISWENIGGPLPSPRSAAPPADASRDMPPSPRSAVPPANASRDVPTQEDAADAPGGSG